MLGKNIPINGSFILQKARKFADGVDCIQWITTRMEREVVSIIF